MLEPKKNNISLVKNEEAEKANLSTPEERLEMRLTPPEEVLEVEKVEPWGLYLKGKGFIHISKVHKIITEHKTRPATPIAEWFPKGCKLKVRLCGIDRHGLTGEITGRQYDLLGFADVIDTKADKVPEIIDHTSTTAKKLLPPKSQL